MKMSGPVRRGTRNSCFDNAFVGSAGVPVTGRPLVGCFTYQPDQSASLPCASPCTASPSFAVVIQQLPLELRDAICVFYLVLRALDTVEDDMALEPQKKVPLLRSFHEKSYDRWDPWCCGGLGEVQSWGGVGRRSFMNSAAALALALALVLASSGEHSLVQHRCARGSASPCRPASARLARPQG
jgi:hypothetical protein